MNRFLDDETVSRLAGSVLTSHPEQGEVIGAFLPLLLARNRLLREADEGHDPKPVEVLRAMLLAVAEGFPPFQEKARQTADHLNEAETARLLSSHGAAASQDEIIAFALEQSRRTLEALAAAKLPEAETTNPETADPQDARRACPYCGGTPELSVIHSTEGQRSLVCGRCGRHWRFRRLACPGCGREEPGNLQQIFVEARPEERGVFCAACGQYVLEVDIRHLHLQPEQCQVLTLGLGALDVLMQQEGKRPLVSPGE